jgi:hypothetical protein
MLDPDKKKEYRDSMFDLDIEINTSTTQGTNKTKGQKVGYHEIPQKNRITVVKSLFPKK